MIFDVTVFCECGAKYNLRVERSWLWTPGCVERVQGCDLCGKGIWPDPNSTVETLQRGGATVAHQPHKLDDLGSSPSPATKTSEGDEEAEGARAQSLALASEALGGRI